MNKESLMYGYPLSEDPYKSEAILSIGIKPIEIKDMFFKGYKPYSKWFRTSIKNNSEKI